MGYNTYISKWKKIAQVLYSSTKASMTESQDYENRLLH